MSFEAVFIVCAYLAFVGAYLYDREAKLRAGRQRLEQELGRLAGLLDRAAREAGRLEQELGILIESRALLYIDGQHDRLQVLRDPLRAKTEIDFETRFAADPLALSVDELKLERYRVSCELTDLDLYREPLDELRRRVARHFAGQLEERVLELLRAPA